MEFEHLPLFVDVDLDDLERYFPSTIPDPSPPRVPELRSAVDRLLRLEATLESTEDFLDLWQSAVRLLIPIPTPCDQRTSAN